MSLFDTASIPFSAALLLMLFLVAAEVIGVLLGVLPSAMVDSALPDLEVDADMDAAPAGPFDADVAEAGSASGGLARFLAWFSIGKVPALVILIVFLAAFGLIGLMLQGLFNGVFGFGLPAVAAVPAVVFAAVYPTRWAGRALAKLFRGAHVPVVSADDFVGRVAIVTTGTASLDLPAEAKLADTTGQAHYVRVEPETDDRFPPGTSVLLTKRVSSVYKAIKNPSEHLSA